MTRKFEQMLYDGRYRGGQKSYEKMSNVISYWVNANHSHSIPFHANHIPF